MERIITGLIVLSICIIPIVILKIIAILKKRRVARLLYELAKKNNTGITQYDTWNSSAIALGDDRKHVFVVQTNKGSVVRNQALNLSSFKKCQVINDNAGSRYKEGNFKVTNLIRLELIGINELIDQICFYDSIEDGFILGDELLLANKWCSKINERIAEAGKKD